MSLCLGGSWYCFEIFLPAVPLVQRPPLRLRHISYLDASKHYNIIEKSFKNHSFGDRWDRGRRKVTSLENRLSLLQREHKHKAITWPNPWPTHLVMATAIS